MQGSPSSQGDTQKALEGASLGLTTPEALAGLQQTRIDWQQLCNQRRRALHSVNKKG